MTDTVDTKGQTKAVAAAKDASARDYSDTLFLPKTDFPMRAGLPEKEPLMLQRWDRMGLYKRLREHAKGRTKFVLHDGPPYANGNLHIGHALNKILKDVVTRSKQMAGYDSNYVPGWDCHGLPIEWKIEEQYRAKKLDKDQVPVVEFRKECRAFADHWIGVQAAEFKRLGVTGDFERPYKTMDYDSEAVIAGELQKFAMTGQLYRGSKPVMWSVVERTALAEAEVEYQDYQSDTVYVKFPVKAIGNTDAKGWKSNPTSLSQQADERVVALEEALKHAYVVIWTTTPWTIPGNRAITYSSRISYGLYEVTESPDGNWAKVGDKLILADKLAADIFKAAKVPENGFERRFDVGDNRLRPILCAHPLASQNPFYGFAVPLLDGDHVTDDSGTGFVHTAPGHGREDFEAWMKHARALEQRGISSAIPFTVGKDGYYTEDAPGFEGGRVLDDNGEKGDANKRVIEALVAAGNLLARGRVKHQYAHSWRSKKPIIYINTPQWFVYMDKPIGGQEAWSAATGNNNSMRAGATHLSNDNDTLRHRALAAIDETTFYPPQGQNRLRGMIEQRPDWVLSRQRAWGVPIAVFRNVATGDLAPGPTFAHNAELVARVASAFEAEGADAWFEDNAKERFLGGLVDDLGAWEKIRDILDVWFDSGSTHAFVLRKRPDLKWPADMYLEGSDQHRGWFHSSLLESCGMNGRAPYDSVLTHGFVMAEDGRKMSKSLGNIVSPQDVIKQSGADILRLWVVTADYSDDLRIGPEILKTNSENYRKVRNTIRWMLGTLAHFEPSLEVEHESMPELERYLLHRLTEIDVTVREAYAAYDFKRVVQAVSTFMTVDLSAFYFDIRKDALYCDAWSSATRRAALTVVDKLFNALVVWLAPLIPFTAEEAWLDRFPGEDASVHFELFPDLPEAWVDTALADRWTKIRRVRRAVTGALELERAAKRIGSSLEAAPVVYVTDPDLMAAIQSISADDFATIAITSGITLASGEAPGNAIRIDEVAGVAVVPEKAVGTRCARSWRVTNDVGSDPAYPDLSARDAAAMREYDARHGAAA
jgi:isoleucyl-tRNA synthetase